MPKALTPAQIDRFREQGFLTGLDVFSPDECERFRHQTETFERVHREATAWALDIKCNLLFDWVYQLSVKPRLLDIVEDLIGPDILLTNSIFRIKEPGSATHYGWHQDAARIQVEPQFVIAYLAIGEATPENGCLRVIPGSNRRIEPFHLVSYADRQVARVTDVDETDAVDLTLGPGQVGIFSCNTIHGSGPNRSQGRRFALINDYTPEFARQSVGMGSGQLARGANRSGLWGEEPAPNGDFSRANIEARRRTLNTYPENVLMGPLPPGAPPSFADENTGFAG